MPDLVQLNPRQPVEDQSGTLRQFMLQMEERENARVAVLRLNKTKADAYALTTAFTRIPGLDGVFESAGGLTIIYASVGTENAGTANTNAFFINVDGIKAITSVQSNGPGFTGNAIMLLPRVFGEGRHKIEIFGKKNTQTTTINDIGMGQESYLRVLEFRV